MFEATVDRKMATYRYIYLFVLKSAKGKERLSAMHTKELKYS